MKTRKTWTEKLADSKGLPKIAPITGKVTTRWGTGRIVIPAPVKVDALMSQVPRGKVTTVNEVREGLARKHQVEVGCPLTTGIFAWIAAHAAEERMATGAKRVTPYWRTLKAGGELNPKFPGGIDAQKQRLAAEGHRFVQRGKRWFVEDYEPALHRFMT